MDKTGFTAIILIGVVVSFFSLIGIMWPLAGWRLNAFFYKLRGLEMKPNGMYKFWARLSSLIGIVLGIAMIVIGVIFAR